MAFFKLHKGAPKHRVTARSAPSTLGSVEALRRRARHRLMGATILVALGVAGLPRLFDSEPRAISPNVPITIRNPSRTTAVTPMPVTPPPAASMVLESAEGTREIPAPPRPTQPVSAPITSGNVPLGRPVSSLPSPKIRNKDKNRPRSEPEPAGKSDNKLDKPDKSPKPFIVHVGTFTNFSKAHAVRVKIESAGFKTYTQIIERKQEKRVLVRVGPLKSRSEADAAAARVRRLDLSANVLERER